MATDNEVKRVVELGRIDRGSAIPLYHQLEYLLRQEIEGGRYQPGDPLPSEGEICGRYEVSRSVVRQTLTNLTHAGLIRTERGRGSFVAESKLPERFVQRTTGLYDDLRRMGHEIHTHVIRQEIADLPPPVRQALQVTEGVQIDRVRSVGGRVIAFIRSFVPRSRCPGLEDAALEDRSLYQVLADDYGLRVASGRRTVEAVAARGEIAKHLGVPDGEPLLLLRSSSQDERGEPLEWFEAWHRADRTMFEIEIITGEPDRPVGVVRPRLASVSPAVPAAVDSAAPLTGPPGGGTVPPEDPVAEITAAIRQSRVVAVLRSRRYRQVADIVRALAAHGVTVVEIAMGGEASAEAIAAAAGLPGVTVGAGTVTGPAEAKAAIEAGARFLASPGAGREVVAAAGTTPVILTGYTVNEAWSAWQETSMPVKIFPVGATGAGYLTALASQLPDVPLLPAGGISLAEAPTFLAAGEAVAIGAALCPPEALAAGDVAAVAERAERLRRTLTETAG